MKILTHSLKIIRALGFIAVYLLIFGTTATAQESVLSPNARFFAPLYDPTANCADLGKPANPSAVTGKKIYAIGDSLTGGMVLANFDAKLKAAGWEVTGIQQTASDTVDKALPKLIADTDKVKASDTILIMLGTNTVGFETGQQAMMAKIKEINSSAKVIWMNLHLPAQGQFVGPADAEAINNLIANNASTLGYTVMDWFAEASNNLQKYPYTSDNVHHTAEGYEARAVYVVEALGQPGAIDSGLEAQGDAQGPTTSRLENANKINAFKGAQITPTAIILHWTAAAYNTPQDIVKALQGRKDADYPEGRRVQLYVDGEGVLHQLTETLETEPIQTINDRSWNKVSIGIEIESGNFGNDLKQHEDSLINNTVQYTTVIETVRELMSKYSIDNTQDLAGKKGIFGHFEVQTSNPDPGQNFMAKVRAEVGAPAATPPIVDAGATEGSQCACPVSASSTATNGNMEQNAETVWRYLIGKQLSPTQVAGIMGNMQAESHFEPRIVEYGFLNSRGEISKPGQPSSLDDVVPPDRNEKGQPGYGLVGWTFPPFKQALRDISAQKGISAGNIGLQLDYLWEVLNQPSFKSTVLDPIVASSTTRESSNIFLLKFERPADRGISMQNKRTSMGEAWLAKFGSVGASTTSATTVGSSAGGSCGSSAGSGTVNADGYSFPVEPQTKSGNSKVNAMSPLPCGSGNCHGNRGTGAAFDIGRQPGSDKSAGAALYAISDGQITYTKDNYKGNAGCFSIGLKSTKDKFEYAYLHTSNPLVKSGQNVTSGEKIGEVGRRACTGNGSDPHLHIDRGCIRGGVPQRGGSPSCRDGGIKDLMNAIFEGLPA